MWGEGNNWYGSEYDSTTKPKKKGQTRRGQPSAEARHRKRLQKFGPAILYIVLVLVVVLSST